MTLTTILIIINVFSALAITVLALMQTSKGDMGSAFGGGGSQSMFGSRGSANFLSRSTSIMCTVFFLTSIGLAYIYSQRADISSVVDQSVIEQEVEQPDVPTIESDIPTIEVENTEEQSDVPTLDVPTVDEN